MIVGQIREEVIDKQNDGETKTKDDAIEEEEMILNVADLSKTIRGMLKLVEMKRKVLYQKREKRDKKKRERR